MRLRTLSVRATRWSSRASYLEKWIVLGVVIGAVAGAGAIVFYQALIACTHFFLGLLAGYHVPTPTIEGGSLGSGPARPWALPMVVGLGALLGGLVVFRFAPEAEGHGTDAAISAVHHNPRGVRLRAVVVKIVASALTIGSGGSGGREGPTGQISAGFGSLVSRVLELQPADGRIAVTTGIGSGIGAIFGAPLGGAVLATEILYRDDFEPAALLPCFLASSVSTVVFGAVEGYNPLFGYVGPTRFADPAQLVWFAVIGVLAGLVGLLYAKGFYGAADLFGRAPWPRWASPALGGVLVGTIGIVLPQVLGTGYGWIQQAMGPRLLTIPIWIVVLVPFARIVATGLSIGSGGSGGIFGPGLVIGAFLGASVWRVFEPAFPALGHSPAPFVIVGMMSCFGSISRAPLAVMIMVAEMTGSLSMLAPAMVAVGIAWLIVRRNDDTIYRSQLKNRSDAPAMRLLAGMPLLTHIPSSRAMARPRVVLAAGQSTTEAREALRRAELPGAPVLDEAGHFEGVVSLHHLAPQPEHEEHEREAAATVHSCADSGAPTVAVSDTLDVALESLTSADSGWIPVLDADRHVVGTVSVSDLVRAYRSELAFNAERMSAIGTETGTFEVTLPEDSVLVGRRLQDARIPRGVLVTSVVRDGSVLVPNGHTELKAGDRLIVLGSAPTGGPGDLLSVPTSAEGRHHPGARGSVANGGLGARRRTRRARRSSRADSGSP